MVMMVIRVMIWMGVGNKLINILCENPFRVKYRTTANGVCVVLVIGS